jgi:hypothetical protein
MIRGMKALSVRQPWAWLILDAGKDIENRNWQPANPALRFRGSFLIHASLTRDPTQQELCDRVKRISGLDLPPEDSLPQGGIVGQVDVTEVVYTSASPWFTGPCGLVLTNPRRLDFRPCRGRLGFFDPF